MATPIASSKRVLRYAIPLVGVTGVLAAFALSLPWAVAAQDDGGGRACGAHTLRGDYGLAARNDGTRTPAVLLASRRPSARRDWPAATTSLRHSRRAETERCAVRSRVLLTRRNGCHRARPQGRGSSRTQRSGDPQEERSRRMPAPDRRVESIDSRPRRRSRSPEATPHSGEASCARRRW